jgi:hypothetical protein
VVDNEIHKKWIEHWIGDDEEMKAFVKKINGRIILTDTSLGRFEEANRPLRRQCLMKLRAFINSCSDVVGPAPVSFLEILKSILEKYFGFGRVGRAKERIGEVIAYISSDKTGQVSISPTYWYEGTRYRPVKVMCQY